MSTYEYIPVNNQFERISLSMLSSSPMFEGRVNPMFPFQVMFTPCVFILMIDVGSSPERIHNSVKTYKKQVTLSYWYDFTEERSQCLNTEGKSGGRGMEYR